MLGRPGGASTFARVEAAGPDRAEAALAELLAHPLLERGESLRRSGAVLVSLEAADLPMAELQRVSGRLHALCGEARVVVGASRLDAPDGRLVVSVLTAGAAGEAAAPAAAGGARAEADDHFLKPTAEDDAEAGATRQAIVPPAPELPVTELPAGPRRRGRVRRGAEQFALPLETGVVLVARNRFEKAPPTKRKGQDLDIPTYIRRGLVLN